MEFIFGLLVVSGLIAVTPLRFKLQERRMNQLANEFGLHFHSEEVPRFIDFYIKLLWERKSRNINNIEGMVDNHKIHIYDKIHFSFLGTPYRTIYYYCN